VAGVVGQFLPNGASTYVSDASVVSIAANGVGGFTISLVDNQGGNLQNFGSPISGTYTIDTFGRVLMNIGPPFGPVFYITKQNAAVMVGMLQNDPTFGIFEPQMGRPIPRAGIQGHVLARHVDASHRHCSRCLRVPVS
jgi:hypothetical protein